MQNRSCGLQELWRRWKWQVASRCVRAVAQLLTPDLADEVTSQHQTVLRSYPGLLAGSRLRIPDLSCSRQWTTLD